MEKNKLAISEFLHGGGEMGEMIRSFDWSSTPLGEPATWQQSLKTCVRIMLTSPQPMFVWWGKNYINIYNDAYKFILGAKHPKALGKPGNETWKEIWDIVGARADIVFNKNEGTFDNALLLIMNRYGYDEETYFSFSYNPIPGDNGGTAGLFCACIEETDRIITERRLNALQDLSKSLAEKKTVTEVLKASIEVLNKYGRSFPYALIYSSAKSSQLVLAGYSSDKLLDFYPESIDTDIPNDRYYDFIKVVTTRQAVIVDDLQERFGDLPSGDWNTPPTNAILVPIFQSNQEIPFAILKVGVNPYRPLDDNYIKFVHLVIDQISTALSNVSALENERKRIQALEGIDRAKTAFFTNISHEFRTPLTLMLGPLEDLMNTPAGNLSFREKNSIETTHRNALRLLKLVNTLLDFSRIESGRQQANFQLTDITSLTKNLASNFRSVIERAGLKFEVKTETITQPVYVDKQMWEKIVFNLLSNAFKYTLNGRIAVGVYPEKDHLVLSVEDTGIGIPEKELPRMFERFHRINNGSGRTFEGTGIGLSLTKELVHLNGGSIEVDSREGAGSIFTVKIPFGKDHLDPIRISNEEDQDAKSLFNIYVEEANILLESDRSNETDNRIESSTSAATVLIVDDNADMREHLRSLLERNYRVVTASNGLNALHKLKEVKPDAIISDVMMPIMDGLQLLKEVKHDKRTARIPFILLTARAGEESKIEGYETGADDYLVKPFAAVELLARVKAQLQISKKWNETEEKLEKEVEERTIDLQRINKELESFNYITSHDLQEPLRKIQTFVELIKRNEDPELNSSYLQRIQTSAYRMSELIKSLLTYSNLSNKDYPFEKTDLNLVLKEVLSDLEVLVEEKNATIESEKLPAINAIPMQMYQVFLNILSNSLKFSQKNPVIKIDHQILNAVSARKVLQSDGNQPYLKLSFIDNGIGIESKFNEQVFKLFQRLHLKNEYPGTGVGLSIVKKVVENHNGHIQLISEPEKGTTITIYLPA